MHVRAPDVAERHPALNVPPSEMFAATAVSRSEFYGVKSSRASVVTGSSAGSVKKKVDPFPNSLSTQMRAPCASTMPLAM
jgi:hypothetical protein